MGYCILVSIIDNATEETIYSAGAVAWHVDICEPGTCRTSLPLIGRHLLTIRDDSGTQLPPPIPGTERPD